MDLVSTAAHTSRVNSMALLPIHSKEQFLKIHWICIGYCRQSNCQDHYPLSLHERIDHLPDSFKWCIQKFWVSNEGQGIAIALSNGLYKENWGSSAWVIEAGDSIGPRIPGWSFFMPQWTYWNACDTCAPSRDLQASWHRIRKNHHWLWWPEKTSFPLKQILWMIHKRIQSIPIHVIFHHVRGHQDLAKNAT